MEYGTFRFFACIIVPFLLLIVLYALRMLGAGDVKLFSAIGAVLGLERALDNGLFFFGGGVIALIILIINRNGKERLMHLFNYLKTVFLTFSIQPYTNFEDKDGKAVFRMTYAITCGLWCFLLK